jgi:probable HAF family extracellular repeat protein
MQTIQLLFGSAAVLMSTVWCGEADAAESFFMGLGDFPGGAFDSRAYGVSADGAVVAGTGTGASGNEAFRWTRETGMLSLGEATSASDVSADGSVVVGQVGSQAFRWTHETGIVGLGDFPRGPFYSLANAVSADGSIVVGRGATDFCTRGCRNIFPPFRWTQASGMTRVNMGTAIDISGDGSVIVGGSSQASSWTQAGGAVGLGDLPDGTLNSHSFGVSADGSVIVGQGNSAAGAEAFRWTQDDGMVGLGILPGFDFSLAQDVSADGSIVVGSVGFDVTYAGAFIWDATHGTRNLHDVLINEVGLGASLIGWNLDYASAISGDGRVIVGYGTNPNGEREAWIARIASGPELPGDFNHNGVVDAADYVVWRNGLGSTYTQSDYDLWREHFGQAAGSSALLPSTKSPSPTTVPEPSAVSTVVFFLLAVVNRRRVVRLAFVAPSEIASVD